MKKILFVFVILSVIAASIPLFASAADFERDLSFGISNDPDVTRLQEFLASQGAYSGPVTGNFFSLTREGVKRFQARENISPVLGYFGPKTRARANAMLAETPSEVSAQKISELEAVIKALEAVNGTNPNPVFGALIGKYQSELASLKGLLVVPVPPPADVLVLHPDVPPVATSTPAPAESPKKELKVSGGQDTLFPIAAVNPTKIGGIEIQNNTDEGILFSQIVLKITDQMNSPLNRGREVIFIIRDGSTVNDSVISSTKFTFNSTVPQPGSPHVSLPSLPYSVALGSGKKAIISLWVDNFDFVISGTLAIELENFLATSVVSPTGGFRFLLHRD